MKSSFLAAARAASSWPGIWRTYHRRQRHPGRGRTHPHTAGIDLENAGVELDERGYVRVNERLETSAPDVWALGECAGTPQFTHISEDDFRIVTENLAGGKRSTRNRLVPYCVLTDPERSSHHWREHDRGEA
jgi:pyruvate/2-oxoglutarate dehydrogenase complex dihydrolipoamide dehydrogenase (E3) component